MLSPKEEMKQIYARLAEIERIINPQNDKFMFSLDHELCPERDRLIDTYYEYKAYERWFSQRHPSILAGMHITGATALQNRINTAVAYNL